MGYYGSLAELAYLCIERAGDILGDDEGVKTRQSAVEEGGTRVLGASGRKGPLRYWRGCTRGW